jgi:hypothetical protein
MAANNVTNATPVVLELLEEDDEFEVRTQFLRNPRILS